MVDFNPYQFASNPKATRRFNRLMVPHFAGCRRVLDLGCGEGGFLLTLRENGIGGIGVDRREESVQHARQLGLQVHHREISDYLALQAAEIASCDGIYCAHVIEHMMPDEGLQFLGSLFLRAAPGTRLVMVTPNILDIHVALNSFWLDITHKRPYPRQLLQRMLEAAGFSSVRTTSVYGLGLDRWYASRYLIDKLRFGAEALKPNLVVTAQRD